MFHNLNNATRTLQNTKNVSSRSENQTEIELKAFEQIMRRLCRLLSHTKIYHKEFFTEYEGETHLCQRFTDFC